MRHIKMFDKHTIQHLTFPGSCNAQYAKRYWLPFLEHGVSRYIKNVDASIKLLRIDDIILPLVLTERNYNSSYVASTYNQYITYAKEELKELRRPLLEKSLAGILNMLGHLLTFSQINRAVYVNNWFLSTNLYPKLTAEQVHSITVYLKEQFPDRAIVFRSINPYSCESLYSILNQQKYCLIGSRQVYFAKPMKEITAKQRKQLKKDRLAAEKAQYEWQPLEPHMTGDLERCLELYNALYIHQYSHHNPQFTLEYFKQGLTEGWFRMTALRQDDRIDGFLGYFVRDGIMTTPLLGYDTSLPRERGLYRMLTAYLNDESEKFGYVLHRSSGAASFKKSRGAIPVIEYNAVYWDHLPRRQQRGWKLLEQVINRAAIPMIQKAGL